MVSMLMTCVHLEFGYLCHIPMITWDQGWLRGECEKTCKPKSKDILVVEDLRKEVHCSMQIIVQTREVIKRTRGCTKSLWSYASGRSEKAIKLRNRIGNANT